MTPLRKRRSGSMFKWYFIRTSISVILCLTISSFAILFFFLNFWKTDKLTALNDDALSVSQSVELFAESTEGTAEADSEIYLQFIKNILLTVANASASSIFVTDAEGSVIMCSDSPVETADEITDNVCYQHENISFSPDMLAEISFAGKSGYTFEGILSGFPEENQLLGAVTLDIYGTKLYVIAVQSESVAFLPYTTEFLRLQIFTSIVALGLCFILAVIFSYRMVRPLKKITAATKHYAGGDFTARINTADVYNELTELVDSVNKMADSLAVLEESRSSFVANVSHELKTPMTVISGFVDGMLDGTISPEESQKYLVIVSDEVKRLSRLVVAMLNMSKIEAGKLTLNTSVFSLKEIFIKTIIGFEKFINDKNIDIAGLDTLENVVITADETLITQIIYNLIDNAVKFTEKGGIITVSVYEEKKEAVFSVRNTGRGITDNEKELVFDRFYKVDKSRGLDAKSFGMGLYIVKSIIELHKGTISLETEENEFTEFIVRLPLQ